MARSKVEKGKQKQRRGKRRGVDRGHGSESPNSKEQKSSHFL